MASSRQNQLTALPETRFYIWPFWGCLFLLLILIFRSGLSELLKTWMNVEEYSHGFFIPCITGYFIWLRRYELSLTRNFKESLLGLSLMTVGLGLFILGSLAAIGTLEQYAFLIVLTGLFAAAFGTNGLRIASVPLFFLIFMVPFPNFIMNNLSAKLQLISSWMGVEFIRSCDIMVYLEGNVIDLGNYRLQVVDACSGLRYLFPLSSLAFLCAYLFKGPFWQKLLIFLSSAPLTVFMNSFRIGVIGVLVDNWGTTMAEGFLHDFEGWAVFLLCMMLLFVEMWIFSRINGKKLAMKELVQIPEDWGKPPHIQEAVVGNSVLNKSAFAALLLLCLGAWISETYRDRVDIIPQRQAFINFPSQLGDWHGYREYLEAYYLNELKLTDYLIENYINQKDRGKVNFYSAYYQTQRKGATVHSPRSCIPGDGWQITLFEQKDFPDFKVDGQPLQVDRAIIEKGENKQLVYFWFQQRGRIVVNEFMVKWYIFYDAITMNRTDGALIRLVTDLGKTEDVAVADQRIQSFMKVLLPQLPAYLPGKSIVKEGYTDISE